MSFGTQIGESYILGLHPVAFMMIIGIAFQAIAECFISPRYLEYFSLQAPKGEEGLYLGFSHLHSFFHSCLLLDCPDFCWTNIARPATFHQRCGSNGQCCVCCCHTTCTLLWYVFVAIGAISAIALFVYGRITRKADQKNVKN